ncbi:phage tail assembly protein T [Piscirickettsia salmonis]|uniref:phage tail assembly protein T n=2 Tax=Piscirickettsia salmonis TaxID=1238 RepID=UPI001EE2C888|nr:DUF4035 domain-containing protein [Piscirickettsia salmonis]
MALRNALFNLAFKTAPVTLGELELQVKELSIAEQQRYQELHPSLSETEANLLLICLSLCDHQGVKIFDVSEYKKLAELPLGVIKQITDAIVEVNGFNESAAHDLKKLAHDHERRFLFRLALALGKTVNQLSQELSLSEFNEWLAYYSLEPFGVEKDDHRTALMVSAVVNGPLQRKDKTLFTPNDFMPNYSAGDEKKTQSATDMAAILSAIAKRQ